MDQFVRRLHGFESEQIFRMSRLSQATMQKERSTINQTMAEVEKKEEFGPWCGFPHHSLVPRSKDYDPKAKNLGGADFVLYAFVTSVGDDVNAGSLQNRKHMICGPKNLKTAKHDGKPYGFPFDKKMNFRLSDKYKFMAATTVKIIFGGNEDRRKIKEKVFKLQQQSPMSPIHRIPPRFPHGSPPRFPPRFRPGSPPRFPRGSPPRFPRGSPPRFPPPRFP